MPPITASPSAGAAGRLLAIPHRRASCGSAARPPADGARRLRGIAVRVLCLLAAGAGSGRHALAADCSRTSVGLTPIVDLGMGTYQGFQGGLYPGGAAARPASHDSAADSAARLVLLDPNGVPDAAGGRIVLLTIGMSNTSQESQAYIPIAAADPGRNAGVTIVNGAQGGWTATRVADPGQNGPFWSTVDQRLAASGVTPLQIQAVWLKQAEAQPTQAFPLDARILQGHIEEIARIVRDRYPNARQLYASSRIYAGYATTPLNPEPYAYQSGFAVKWMIERQLAGDADLGFDPARGIVEAPWMAWGPYLWADGLIPRSDGLTWECSDLRETDGTHPSETGAAKAGALLHGFFMTDPLASRWYADCNPSDPGVFAAPPRVLNLDVGIDPVSGGARLAWQNLAPAAGAATRYDLVTGSLGDIAAEGGFASAVCTLAMVSGTGGPDPIADPPPGGGVYYLVRGHNACGAGTYGEPDALAGPRAALDAASPCP